eukprot:CAMPEP_0194441102 /NCGR_PEP_ID=MMETSP0176-20130528/119746_1 /TAXON_ID=216777 /ORGANISM="Proboscia alata, Strain PI-D3" /LENGTH=44 /DNA_ID= /DNA_START= /DNA_END= /DNA_ORIENTATION=
MDEDDFLPNGGSSSGGDASGTTQNTTKTSQCTQPRRLRYVTLRY